MDVQLIGAGIGIGLAGMGVAAGQGYLIYKTMRLIGKNPKLTGFFLTATILGVALVESAAIYALLVAFQILETTFSDPMAAIGAGAAIGLTGLGVGIGEGILVARSMEAINFNPEYKNRLLAYMVLYVALIESSAIYGLIVALQILFSTDISGYSALGSALAIGLTGLGVGIGEGLVGQRAILEMGEDPKRTKLLLPFSVLAIALVESSAIYGLIVAIQSLSSAGDISNVGAGLAIGLAGLGVSLGEASLLNKSVQVLASDEPQPTDPKKLIPMAVLAVALVESAAIYALVVALQILSGGGYSMLAVGAGITIGLAGLGVSIGEGILCTKAIEAGDIERLDYSKIVTFMILSIALVESAAIYGLLIALQILNSDLVYATSSIGIGFAIGFASMGVGIGEGILSSRALENSSKRPRYHNYFLTTMILGIALVESVAIYGLLVASSMLNISDILPSVTLSAGFSIGLTALGVGIFEGLLVAGSFQAMSRNPNNKAKDLTLMILFLALVESVAIYGLFIAMNIVTTFG